MSLYVSDRWSARISGKPNPRPMSPSTSDGPLASTTPAMTPAAPPMISGTTTNAPTIHRMNAMFAPSSGVQYG